MSYTMYVNVRDENDVEVIDKPFTFEIGEDDEDPMDVLVSAINEALGDDHRLNGVYTLGVWRGPNRTGDLIAEGGVLSVWTGEGQG